MKGLRVELEHPGCSPGGPSRLGAPELREAAEKIGYAGIEQFESARFPWPCGVPGADETPCLMLGTGGIAYFYLRLANPALPTVLMVG